MPSLTDAVRDHSISAHLALGAYLWFHDPATIAPGIVLFTLGAWHAYGTYIEPALIDNGIIERPFEELEPEEVEAELDREWLKQLRSTQAYQPKDKAND